MKIIENLTIDSMIPLKNVELFDFFWGLNKHAVVEIKGILESEQFNKIDYHQYKNTTIKIEYANEIIFNGIIKKTKINVSGGLYQIGIEAISATIYLDMNTHNELFQDTSVTYKQMLQQLILKKSGNMIFTVKDRSISKPLFCYVETLWQYAQRMASHYHSHIVADIKTGKPNFWFGMRIGSKIKSNTVICVKIEVRKSLKKKESNQISYLFQGSQQFMLGDQIFYDGDWQIIYEKRACLRHGEIIFTYWAMKEEFLFSETFYCKDLTGLSLQGVIVGTENEYVNIKLDIDKKEGVFPFPWYPETGNVLYAMPEIGAKAEVYFNSSDEREAVAIRCRHSKGCTQEEKALTVSDNNKIISNSLEIKLEKLNNIILSDSAISLNGNERVKVYAAGKVTVKAKKINIKSSMEIGFVETT